MFNFPTPHCHPKSLDTASTPEAFLRRELELETGTLTCTDHGTMDVSRKLYSLARSNNLTPILGLEAYFRDDSCPILTEAGVDKDKDGTFIPYLKYMHLTMHYMDQEAFLAGVRLLSLADARAERHGGERKPLYGWAELEELGSKNITFGSGCLIGMVQRHLMGQQRPDLAFKYYERLRSTVKHGNFFVEVFPHVCDRNWASGVDITFADGTVENFPIWKTLMTDAPEGKIKAEALADAFSKKDSKHKFLKAVMMDRKWVDKVPKEMTSVVKKEGFIMNECLPWCENGDLQKSCNDFMLRAARKYGDPIIISDDSHYATVDEHIVQDVRLGQSGNWRFFGNYHRQSSAEAFEHFKKTLGTSERDFESWVDNNRAWAERFKGFEFKDKISLPTKFYPENTLLHMKKLIDKHGRMRWDDPVYEARLIQELDLLHNNGTIDLLPYFFPIEEITSYYQDNLEMLTGPGRGSAAGLLLAYVLGITHADPIKFNLSQERFITLDRIKTGKLPDIDQDLGSRDPLVDGDASWLKRRFGDHFAQISVDTTLKVRSSVKDVARVLHDGKVPSYIEELTKKFLMTPQGVEDSDYIFGYTSPDGEIVEGTINEEEPDRSKDKALQKYITLYPEEWTIVKKCLGLARNKSRHACAYVIANDPIHTFIPLMSVSGITVTQYTAKWVEASGGLKMDFLVVNSLNDIGDCIKLIHEANPRQFKFMEKSIVLKNGLVPTLRIVPHPDRLDCLYDIWDLPEDQAVFNDICEGKTETVFQFNTNGSKGWLKKFDFIKKVVDGVTYKGLSTFEDLAAFTSLNRPGPLDAYVSGDGSLGEGNKGKIADQQKADREGIDKYNMLEEYARRAEGKPAIGALPVLNELLPETYGVIVYQEQLQHIFQKLGDTTAAEANNFREHVSKKMKLKVEADKLIFMKGAVPKINEETALTLWNMMETFGRYGFNKSHAVCYASKIGYACAWLKHHYPLQWWTAVLRNAKKDEINTNFWSYCGHLIDMPDINLSGDKFEIHNDRIRAPIDLLHGIGEKAHAQLLAGRPYADIQDFCNKIEAYKVTNAKEVDTEINGVTVKKIRKGHSSLNRSVVATLIISGAMESLFPKDSVVEEQLYAFEQATSIASKKKLVAVDKKYQKVDQLIRYQMKKAVLPAYSADLLPMIAQRDVQGFSQGFNGVPKWTSSRRGFKPRIMAFRSGQEIELLNQESMPIEGGIDVAAAAYVKSERRFGYGNSKEALELVLDINGVDIKTVKWPGKEEPLPKDLKNFVGSIVIVTLSKFAAEKPFALNDITVVQGNLDLSKDEASP